jgi:hypothetical protein
LLSEKYFFANQERKTLVCNHALVLDLNRSICRDRADFFIHGYFALTISVRSAFFFPVNFVLLCPAKPDFPHRPFAFLFSSHASSEVLPSPLSSHLRRFAGLGPLAGIQLRNVSWRKIAGLGG